MSQAGSAPKQIMTALYQQNPSTYVAATDIRNVRKLQRAKYLGSRSPVEALLDDLSTAEWVFDVKKDSDNRIQYLFFAHQKQVEYLRVNPDVILMDCTYRTNKYKFPLFHLLGCNSLGKFFSAGFCFLRTETQEDYHWALSTFFNLTGIPPPHVFISDQEDALKNAALAVLPSVPQLLCIWHINMNVLTKAQQIWRDSGVTIREEKDKLQELRSKFMNRFKQVRTFSLDLRRN